jgi:3-oxoacyl-[acyl-carrier protein] reductase
LVTGAGNGIGRAVALALARSGASVVANDLGGDWQGVGRDERPASAVVDEIVAAGGRAVADHGDVADADGAEAMVRRAVDEFGRLDAVVNTAGILRDRMLFSMGEDDWDLVLRVHLRGHFCVTRAACAYWRGLSKETGGSVGGRVVCFTSEAGLYGNLGQANYAAAKAGIASFSTAVAREMHKYGVTSNAIAPRARTRMVEATVGGILPEVEDGWDSWDPANVAPVVAFLASEEGGRYSGQILVAGGGVLQMIDPYRVAAEVKLTESAPTPEDVQALLSDTRGPEARPEPFPMPIDPDQIRSSRSQNQVGEAA